MLNLTAKELTKMLTESGDEADGLVSELSVIRLKINQLHGKMAEGERALGRERNKTEAIKEALVIIKGIPRKVSEVRKRFISNINKLKREDITISEQKSLQTETEELKKELRKNCSHPFVFHREGYSGTQSDDFEDGYPSERYCVVCGLGERAKDFCQNGRVDEVGRVFDVLKSSEDRVIHREPYRQHPEHFSRHEILVPLAVIMRLFEEEVAKVLNH